VSIKVPFLDLRSQHAEIEADLTRVLQGVIRSGQFIGGPKLLALEEAISGYTGARHSVGVSSGTDALMASLMALNIGHGDLVITTVYSFFATAGVVARLGATPVFLDINPETYNVDPERLSEWLERDVARRQRVKAIIPVHLFGQCAEMQPILDLANTHGIAVVEDAAQALGARYPLSGRLAHAGTLGTLGCLSFHPTKNLGAMGDGGMVLTNDDGLADKLRQLRDHGSRPKYHHAIIGGNFRLDAIQAAVLLVKLSHVDAWQARRQEHAAYYDEHLQVDGLITPRTAFGRNCHVYNPYVVSVPEHRDELRQWLSIHGVETQIYYPVPFHAQPCFADLKYASGDFPHAEHAAGHALALPVYPELTSAMQDHVIERIHAFYRQA
jgi:dTDP-4-amino-4,6-dideoxygalactose transaminase